MKAQIPLGIARGFFLMAVIKEFKHEVTNSLVGGVEARSTVGPESRKTRGDVLNHIDPLCFSSFSMKK